MVSFRRDALGGPGLFPRRRSPPLSEPLPRISTQGAQQPKTTPKLMLTFSEDHPGHLPDNADLTRMPSRTPFRDVADLSLPRGPPQTSSEGLPRLPPETTRTSLRRPPTPELPSRRPHGPKHSRADADLFRRPPPDAAQDDADRLRIPLWTPSRALPRLSISLVGSSAPRGPSDLRSKISDLRSQVSDLRSQIADIRSQISVPTSQIADLRSKPKLQTKMERPTPENKKRKQKRRRPTQENKTTKQK